MYFHMTVQVASPKESFVAHLTCVLLLSAVYPHVPGKRVPLSKTLLTKCTRVGSDLLVDSHVSITSSKLAKRLATNRTFIKSLAGVYLLMGLYVGPFAFFLATYAADVDSSAL